MKYLKYFESLFDPYPRVIELEITDTTGTDVGSVDGIIHFSKENVDNWLNKEKVSQELQAKLWKNIDLPVAILKNINVYEDQRNRGFGNDGMELFLDETDDANSVILLADTGESNNFELEKWYEGFGFQTIGLAGGLPLMILSDDINESNYFSNDKYEFEEDSIGYHSGQNDMVMRMYSKNKELLAQLDYTIYNGEISIKFIKSLVKGKGYGEELMKEFCKKYKYEDIDFGGMSEEGTKLKRKLDKFYNYDPIKNMESKNAHLSKDILLNIKNADIKEFLKNLIEKGYKEAWNLLKSTNYSRINNEYDLNDIAEIACWVKGSLCNDNYPTHELPVHVLDLLDEICS